jgi:hypothetical protein
VPEAAPMVVAPAMVMNMLHIGDRVTYTRKIDAFPYGWPVGRSGAVVFQPYRNIWYVQLDGFPLSRVPTTLDMVKVIPSCHRLS